MGKLCTRGTGANDSHALPSQVQVFTRPVRWVQKKAFETVDALPVGNVSLGGNTCDQEETPFLAENFHRDSSSLHLPDFTGRIGFSCLSASRI